jgi:hypothetical protein
MPLYFFHLHTESGIELDPTGLQFSCLEAAVADARLARSEIMKGEAVEGAQRQRRWRFEIIDQVGQVVATVPAADQ